MKFIFFTLLVVLIGQAAKAENSANSSSPKQRISYELRNLKPVSFTQFYLVGMFSSRQYIKFQNEAGNHQFLYEESSVYATLPEIQDIKHAASITDYVCAADIECDAKAFCTNSCKDMYYELSNLPAALAMPEVNHCRISYFSCVHESRAGANQEASTAP